MFPSCLHPASVHREGFKAVLTQQWFEWFVCTVGLCLLVTIQSFLMLTGYQFFQCQGSTYIHYSWLLAVRLNVCQLVRATITFWRQILYTCRDYAFISALWTRAEPFSFQICTQPCVGLARQLSSEVAPDEWPSDAAAEHPSLEDESQAHFNCCWRGPFYGAPRKSQRLSETSLRFPNTHMQHQHLCVCVYLSRS